MPKCLQLLLPPAHRYRFPVGFRLEGQVSHHDDCCRHGECDELGCHYDDQRDLNSGDEVRLPVTFVMNQCL